MLKKVTPLATTIQLNLEQLETHEKGREANCGGNRVLV